MSVESISPYIFLNGNGNEAIAFYSDALGAKTSHIMYWREMPAEYGGCVPEDEGRVMHAEIAIGPVALLIADRPSSRSGPLGGNIDIHLGFSDAASLDAAYGRLAEGGEALMAPHDAFWGARFATLRDRFGVTWVFSSPFA